MELGKTLRHSLADTDVTLEGLFDNLKAKDTEAIAKDKFCKYVAKLKDCSLSKPHVELAFQSIAHGDELGRRAFLKSFQLYQRCIKEVKMTSDLDIGTGRVTKKLEFGDLLEVLEGPRPDPLGLMRARCRVLADSKIGWVTMKGNEGTMFLKDEKKQYLRCMCDIKLQDGISSDSTLRTLKTHEVVEVLEGPRLETPKTAKLVQGKGSKEDSKKGWIMLKDRSGEEVSKLSDKHYICAEVIALTDKREIKAADCKVVKKLQPKDILEVLEGPLEDDESGVTRIRCKIGSGQEGWVTTKGNSGTTYAARSTRHYVVLKATGVLNKFALDDAQELETLEAGSVFESMGAPREEKAEERHRIRCKALADGQVGWITQTGLGDSKGKGKSHERKNLGFSTLHYKAEQKTPIHDLLDISAAKAVRSLEPEEIVEAIEGPVVLVDGLVRLRGRAEKDGITGWMTVAGTQGTMYLQSIVRN